MGQVSAGQAQADARLAMRCAIHHDYGRTLGPFEVLSVVPSKAPLAGFGIGDEWVKWKRTLERAISHLRSWGYTISDDPEFHALAKDLLDKAVSASNTYLFSKRLATYRDQGVAATCDCGGQP